jgi:hypothetical protein
MRHHFRHPQAMFNKGSLFYSHCGRHANTWLGPPSKSEMGDFFCTLCQFGGFFAGKHSTDAYWTMYLKCVACSLPSFYGLIRFLLFSSKQSREVEKTHLTKNPLKRINL